MIKRYFDTVLLFCLLLVFTSVPQAREVPDLYQAFVPVKTQERAERLRAYPQALSQVIIKLSGNRMAPDFPEMAGAMTQALAWVQSYHYDTLPEENHLALKEEGYQRMLVVEFDAQAVSQALVDAGVPLWSHTRPEVLLWLAVEDRGARYLLAASASAEMESVLDDYSRRRGLPLMLPLVDLEDQMRIGFADVWGNFRQTIVDASVRYGVDAVLVGRLYRPYDGPWRARWTLYQGSETQHWQVDGMAQENVLGGGVEGAADRIAQRYAQVLTSDAADEVVLTVTGIGSLVGYAKAMKYLASLDVVSRVRVSSVAGDEVVFDLDIRGDVKGLEQAIALGETLRQVAAVQRMMERSQAYVYQLLP